PRGHQARTGQEGGEYGPERDPRQRSRVPARGGRTLLGAGGAGLGGGGRLLVGGARRRGTRGGARPRAGGRRTGEGRAPSRHDGGAGRGLRGGILARALLRLLGSVPADRRRLLAGRSQGSGLGVLCRRVL